MEMLYLFFFEHNKKIMQSLICTRQIDEMCTKQIAKGQNLEVGKFIDFWFNFNNLLFLSFENP